MQGIPAQREIKDILFDEKRCAEWLLDFEIISQSTICQHCSRTAWLDTGRETYRHYCGGRRKEQSMWSETFFSRSKLPCCDVMNLLYHWVVGASHTHLLGIGGHSSATITRFLRDANSLISNSLQDDYSVIGGPGIEVEIDESKLARRKNNRGHHVEGVWVIGGVERTEARRIFLVPVERRDSQTIASVVTRHVAEGSTILTDCWRGYNCLDGDLDYEHKTVNHTRFFKDPSTGVHTNTIEGTWSAVKAKIAKRYRTRSHAVEHLNTFIWRRQNERRLWEALLAALKLDFTK